MSTLTVSCYEKREIAEIAVFDSEFRATRELEEEEALLREVGLVKRRKNPMGSLFVSEVKRGKYSPRPRTFPNGAARTSEIEHVKL